MTIVAGLTEMMTYWIIMLIGSMLSVVFPYIMNRWKDPKTTVNWVYVGILIFASIVVTFFLLPGKVEVIDVDAIKLAVAAGYGASAVIGKTVKTILETKEVVPEESQA